MPVSLKSFNAKRVNTTAALNWETVSESNNRGYFVQRNTGGGWKDISFVASKAAGGNSSSLLTYEFNEANDALERLGQAEQFGKIVLNHE